MLHDPSHYSPPPIAEEIRPSARDVDVLRRLAGELAEIAALPVHAETARLWQKLNDLESVRPMVWVNEIPWHEIDVNGELTLVTEHPWARDQECELRRTLYQWRHMRGDMVVNPELACPLAIHSTDFDIIEDVDVVQTDAANDIVSRHFKIQIRNEADLEKIKMPVVAHNEAATHFRCEAMCRIFGDIMPVVKQGADAHLVHALGLPDSLVGHRRGDDRSGERPELVHAGVERMVDAWMVELDQFEAQNLLALDCNNTRVGSGGYGYTSQLPGGTVPFDPAYVRPRNMWGCSNAQIFSEVSPRMHWDFALQHDLRWLARWGLTYYGCCEPLDRKIDILRRVPNLRKISVSPWCNTKRMVAQVGRDYVLSRKPSPAIVAEDTWQPQRARQEIRDFLDQAKGCHVELILKDISTVRRDPQRLWQWVEIAKEEAEAYAVA